MENPLLEIELDDINRHHAEYERAHARLVALLLGLGIGVVGLLVLAVPMLMWPRAGAHIDWRSTWAISILGVAWLGTAGAAYLDRLRAFRRVRDACLRLRHAGYRLRREDVHFASSQFGVTEPGADDRRGAVDVSQLSSWSLHARMR